MGWKTCYSTLWIVMILRHSRSALQHMPPLSLCPASSDRPQVLSAHVLKEVDRFLNDISRYEIHFQYWSDIVKCYKIINFDLELSMILFEVHEYTNKINVWIFSLLIHVSAVELILPGQLSNRGC